MTREVAAMGSCVVCCLINTVCLGRMASWAVLDTEGDFKALRGTCGIRVAI